MEQPSSVRLAAEEVRDRAAMSVGSGPTPEARPRLFIVHAPEDAWFVDGFLLGALDLPDGEVLVSSKLELGAVIVQEIERGAQSPVTVVVLSPAFLASPWARFANQLASQHRVEAADDGTATLVPALLADCELPLLSRSRVPLDFRRPEHWEAEAQKLRSRLAAQVPVPVPVVAQLPCPYPGIRPFTSEDADHFHGRNQEIAELLGRLRDGQRELYVIGPSGSGKSSLVAAGLVPNLRRSPQRAGGAFVVRPMRPGRAPLHALATALDARAAEPAGAALAWLGDAVGRLLARCAEHERLLIVVDQLEELFTISDAAARAVFFAALRALRGQARVALVLTLRADFYASLMESELWTDLDGQLARVEVAPLRGDKLRGAIEAPARALGVYFEPVLVERLLHDVADEPGALPLLQDVLLELWCHRTCGVLRLAEYEAMSDGTRTGLAVTVARRADGALGDLSPARRAIARRVLVRLVQFGDGTMLARRQQTRGDLATAGDAPEDIDLVIRHLADRRLITTGVGDRAGQAGEPATARIDLAHEVLLSAWPVLAEWIRARRGDEQRRRVLEAKANEWVRHGRGPFRLLDSDELREARGWLTDDQARDLGVSEAVLDLLARSEAQLAEQRAEAERQARVAEEQARETRRLLARSYVAQAHAYLMSHQPAQAAPYLLAAREAGLDDVALHMLFRWASQGVPLLQLAHDHRVRAVAWSPDGTRLATASADHTARIWDARSGQLVAPPLAHDGTVELVAWSPDGTRLATGSDDGTARIWNAASGLPVTPPLAHEYQVRTVAWRPDGTRLATGSWDHTVRIWDAATGLEVTQPLVHDRTLRAVAWSPDGTRLATASAHSTAHVWDVATEQVVIRLAHEDSVLAITWSPDGARIATASKDRTARIWDAVSGQPMTSPLRHGDDVTAVGWSPDGRHVATASRDGTARVWHADRGSPRTEPLAHDGEVTAIAWSPDEEWLATTSQDGTARMWELHSGQLVTAPLVHRIAGRALTALDWSPDGTRLATTSTDTTTRVWDAVNAQRVASPLPVEGEINAPAWSPNGVWLAQLHGNKTVHIVRRADLQRRTLAHPRVAAVAWSPDGTRLATASEDGTARAWFAASGEPVAPWLSHDDEVTAVAWSPDGTHLATASTDCTAQVWDAVTGHAVTPPFVHEGGVRAVEWSPDGVHLATAGADHTARVWNAATGQLVAPPLVHQSVILAVAWSPDGLRVATASMDRTARVWDATTGHAVTPPLTHRRQVNGVAWSPDGTRVATASDDRTARVWDATTGQALTPPLAHRSEVRTLRWSPDGTRLEARGRVASSYLRVWDVTGDDGTLADWRAVVERGDYRLNRNGVLVTRDPSARPSRRPHHLSLIRADFRGR